ncbi:MAG: DUF1854 domain-containing protein [Planctomycetaceae bacterium]|nr:DUF1854 domain-containing protein [Planctomycetaceae bacterium]
MSSGSVRLHVPLDLHGHEDPPDGGGREAIPEPTDEAAGRPGACAAGTAGRLWRDNGVLYFQDGAGGEASPARLVWARPLSGRGGPVSVMQAGKKRELAYLTCVDELSEDSRHLALEELEGGMVLPIISEIRLVKPRFGNYYWDVETNLGPQRFLLSSPENNSYRPGPDTVVLRDVSGNCYEISSISKLSRASRMEMERVL